jgi:hypothetical protein
MRLSFRAEPAITQQRSSASRDFDIRRSRPVPSGNKQTFDTVLDDAHLRIDRHRAGGKGSEQRQRASLSVLHHAGRVAPHHAIYYDRFLG